MLTMPEINSIKFLRNHKSKSVNEIAKTLKINWRTAKKYADIEQIPAENTKIKTGMMYEGEWGEIISDWLCEDLKLKRKSRRTNITMHKDLKEMGFPGSYRTVCDFIKEWREGRERPEEEKHDKSFERLSHPPAEAQLDFGLMEAVKDGKYVDVHGLVMTLPFSNSGFAVPLPGENQECLLHGMTTIFKQLGGVPRSIRIDNMKTAVVKPRSRDQETVFTDEFLRFANYFGFEPKACNAYSGHEKGSVENKVGYIRYNFITPAPVITDLQHFTKLLEEQLAEDRGRKHYEKKRLISELLEEEQQFLLCLPDDDYPIFKEEQTKTNKYGEILLDQVRIYIPMGYNFSRLTLIKYWDKYKVVSPYGEVLHEDYRPYMQKGWQIPWDTILRVWTKKPRAVNHSRFSAYLPSRILEYLKIEDHKIRKERINWLISILSTRTMEEVNEQFYELVGKQTQNLKEPVGHPFEVDWEKYDQLQGNHLGGAEA